MRRTEGGWVVQVRRFNSDLVLKFFAHFPFTALKTVSFSVKLFFLLLWVPARNSLIDTLFSSSLHFASIRARLPPPRSPYTIKGKQKKKREQRFSIFSVFSSKEKEYVLFCGATRNRKYLKILAYSCYPVFLTSCKCGVICQNIGSSRQRRIIGRFGAIFGAISFFD